MAPAASTKSRTAVAEPRGREEVPFTLVKLGLDARIRLREELPPVCSRYCIKRGDICLLRKYGGNEVAHRTVDTGKLY